MILNRLKMQIQSDACKNTQKNANTGEKIHRNKKDVNIQMQIQVKYKYKMEDGAAGDQRNN